MISPNPYLPLTKSSTATTQIQTLSTTIQPPPLAVTQVQFTPAPVVNQPPAAVVNQPPAPMVNQAPAQPPAPAIALPVAAPAKRKQGYFQALAAAGRFRTTMQNLGQQLQQALQAQNYSQAIGILQQMLAAYNALSPEAQSIVGSSLARQLGAQIANLQFLLSQQLGQALGNVVIPLVSNPPEPLQSPPPNVQSPVNPIP